MNISSIIVRTAPQFLDEVITCLNDYKECDYHMHDQRGFIIVTIEGENVTQEMAKLKHIQEIPHIIAADMHYSYSEEELEKEREKFYNQDPLMPDWLNDDNAKLSDIKYNGDLKKKY